MHALRVAPEHPARWTFWRDAGVF